MSDATTPIHEPEKRRGAFEPLPETPPPSEGPLVLRFPEHKMRPFAKTGAEFLSMARTVTTIILNLTTHTAILTRDDEMRQALEQTITSVNAARKVAREQAQINEVQTQLPLEDANTHQHDEGHP